MAKTDKSMEEKTRDDRINCNVQSGQSYHQPNDQQEKPSTLSAVASWVISIGCFLVLWGFFELYCKHHLDFSEIFTADFYTAAFYSILPRTSGLPPLLFLIVLILFYIFAVTTAYNLFDLLSSPYWIATRKTQQRKSVRKWTILILLVLPVAIPIICIIGLIWFSSNTFFGMFGIPNPFTKSGQADYAKMSRPSSGNTDSDSSSDITSPSPGSRQPCAAENFTRDWINAKASGGAYPVEQTYGLTQEEMTMAIANAEAYLDSLGYK